MPLHVWTQASQHALQKLGMAYAASKPQPYDSSSPCQEIDSAWRMRQLWTQTKRGPLICGNRYGGSQQVSQTCSAGPGRWRMPRWVCT